ncbi:MAG TPA: formyltransferase family protein [Thermoanaerobaculia bacterium]|nr:formyltransferase family protein [Thermoanaerobaculia bacterium]
MRVVFCVSGNGLLFRAAVARRAELAIEPALLVARPNAAADLEDFCAAHGVPIHRFARIPREAFDRTISEVCIGANADLVSLTFDRIIPPAVVAHYARRIINVHPSLLPSFAGTNGAADTLKNGARFGGATIHEVVDEVDAGPIIAQCAVATIPGESAEAFGKRMFRLLEPMYLQVLKWYAEGRVGHDDAGRVVIRGARYGELPIAPSLEAFTPRESV